MAKLRERYRYKGGEKIFTGYAAVFYDPLRQPNEKYVTLRTKDERVANRRLVDYEKKESLGLFDPWVDPVPRKGVSVAEAAEKYVKKRKVTRRPKTVKADESTLNLFVDSLPAGSLLSHVEARHIENFLNAPKKSRQGKAKAKKKKLSSATRQTYYTRIRAFFSWCREQGWMQHEPTVKVERPKLAKKEKSFFTHEQYQRLRRAIEADVMMKEAGIVNGEAVRHTGLHEGAIRWLLDVIEVAVSTGLRETEIVHMRWSWINFDAGQIVVRRSDGFIPKSHHERTVPISGACLDVLWTLHEARTSEADDYVFKGEKNGDRLDASYVSKRFKKYVKLAQLSDDLTFHSLRHTFITWMVQRGVPVPVVQKLAGHADISTTMQYVHVAGGDLHDAVSKMNEWRETVASN
ncbi:MAG: tyrosine-type recombinase/integrase [Rhodothermales bacterium]